MTHHKLVLGTTLPALHIDGRMQKLDTSADLTQVAGPLFALRCKITANMLQQMSRKTGTCEIIYI